VAASRLNQPVVDLRYARQGDTVTYGTYPQTAGGADKTPIAWRVLQNSGSELFLLSHYILDCKRYHHENSPTQWRDCDLRDWLNREFYTSAFSAEERERILLSLCADNGRGKADTQDKVFLLSVAEVVAFTDPGDGDELTIRRRTIGTDFAKAEKPDGCHLYVYDKGVESDYVLENGRKQGCSWWWTRSQHQDEHPDRATFIGARSNIKRYGQVALSRGAGVRPALRLSLD
jgi:hypothetical protein